MGKKIKMTRHKVGKKIKMTAGCQLFLHSGRDSQCEKAQIGLS